MSEFVEVKTQDLLGAALDWAVAKSIGAYRGEYVVCESSEPCPAWIFPEWFPVKATTGEFKPSTDWAKGGPLVEGAVTALCSPRDGYWWAHARGPLGEHLGEGDTLLFAACRAIVSSVLGDTVSVPKELLP